MTRVPHVLNPTSGEERPHRIVFWDTETKQEKTPGGKTEHFLKLGIAIYCELDQAGKLEIIKELEFSKTGELWDFIEGLNGSKKLLYMVAHNLIFDLVISHGFSELYNRGWKLESYYSKRMTNILRWRKDKTKLLFLDNGNFFSGKLETWGKRVGVPKTEIDFSTCTNKDLLEYCRNDVLIMVKLWDTWLSFLDEHDCGSFKVTVASTAFNTFRHRFLKHRLHIHTAKEAIKLERESYRGGRTECLWVGERSDGPFYYLDINSMYGHILSTQKYPAGIWSWYKTDDLWALAYKLKRYGVVARVQLNVPEPWFPIDIDRHTVFPIGDFEAVLTTPELKHAMSRGWITAVSELATYRMLPLFRGMIDYFYHQRLAYEESGDVGYAGICKLLINSFYGKFGQRGIVQEVIGQCDIDKVETWEIWDMDNKRFYDLVFIGGTVFKEWAEGEAYHSFPAIAAHVTAYARLYLNSFRMKVPPEHVYYMDTDSLIVDQIGYEALKKYIQPGVLGKLKVEHVSETLNIHSAKDYQMDDRIRTKGIRRTAEEIQPGEFLQDKWPGLAGLIRAGNLDRYQVESIVKRQRRLIYSGIVSESGWIEPFRLVVEQETFPIVVPALLRSVYPSSVA